MAKTKLHPAAGYLIIEPQAAAKQTASGIYLPESSDEKPQMGKVLAVGADALVDGTKVASPAKVGETVVYKKWGANEVKVDGTEYLFAKFEDVLAIVK